jgi:hypothetical protein
MEQTLHCLGEDRLIWGYSIHERGILRPFLSQGYLYFTGSLPVPSLLS